MLSHKQNHHHLGDCYGASGLHPNVAKSESNFNRIPRRFIYTLNFEKQWLRHLQCLLIGLQLLLWSPISKSLLHLHGRKNSEMPLVNSHTRLSRSCLISFTQRWAGCEYNGIVIPLIGLRYMTKVMGVPAAIMFCYRRLSHSKLETGEKDSKCVRFSCWL